MNEPALNFNYIVTISLNILFKIFWKVLHNYYVIRLMPKGINILSLYCLFLSLYFYLYLSLFLISTTQHFKLA